MWILPYTRMFSKRSWLWRVRSRGQMKHAVLLVVCLAASVLVLDSLVAIRTDQGYPSFTEQEKGASSATLTRSSPLVEAQYVAPPKTEPRQRSSISAAGKDTMLLSNSEDSDGEFEGKGMNTKLPKETPSNERLPAFVLSKDIEKLKENKEEPKHFTETSKNANEGASFGFVNKNFEPPPPRQRQRSVFGDLLQGIMQGQTVINPGSLLGALAAVKQLETFRPSHTEQESKHEAKEPPGSATSFPKTNNNTDGRRGQGPDTGSIKKMVEKESLQSQKENSRSEGGVGEKEPLSPGQMKGGQRPNTHRMKGVVGVMSSLLGHDRRPGGSVLGSFVNNLAPLLLSSARSKNDRQMEGGGGASEPSPLGALVGGLGPVLLAGMGALGGGDPDSASGPQGMGSVHSIISQVGSSIMAEQALHPNSANTFQSLLSNLGPVLLAGFSQGNKQGSDRTSPSNSNPMQSILGGLGPALMAMGALQKGLSNNSGDDKERPPQSPLQAIVSGVSQSLLGVKQAGLGGLLAEVAPALMAGAAHRGSRSLQGTKGETEASQDNNVIDSPADHKLLGTRLGVGGAAARLVLQGALSSLLPEELSLPETNSVRGIWDMAINLGFGNPRDDHNRTSRFWRWLREYGGGKAASDSEDTTTPAWITAALTAHDQQRATHAATITKVYKRLEVLQPLCHNVLSVGGLFSWKTGVLADARDVCMDPDVAPRSKDCVVYSFGVRDKWGFEEDMEDMGCEVFAFDPSMTTGNHNHSSNIHFYNLGLTASSAATVTTRHGQVWRLFPLAEVMARLAHNTTAIDYLKLDIGGDEWQVLKETAKNNRHTLTNLRQLGVEVHLEDALKDPKLYTLFLETLEDLESLGFQLFSSRATQRRGWSYQEPLLQGRQVSLHYDLAFLRV
ncbi:uncharacterized protein LOC127001882 isoform X2 [Eriocheir sinensis]|uniref:uncharacterized protein LOC127001882 isoform X2 n=1 Tax=Eriocheir sinensis TaxID=95602 RepID=UPI0021C8106C|nr:uncharacterized protein LOC127001882 isoform X2 [Eriocheir sinensis]